MIYNKETIDRNIKLITDIYNIKQKDITEYEATTTELKTLDEDYKHAIENLESSKNERLAKLDAEIEIKTQEFISKAQSTVNQDYSGILSEVEIIEEFMNEHYGHFADNEERHTREASKLDDTTDLNSRIHEIRSMYVKVEHDTQTRSQLAGKLSNLLSKLQDKLIESRSKIGIQETVAIIIVLGIVVYQISNIFLNSSTLTKILSSIITVGAVVGVVVAGKRFIKDGNYVKKDTIYRIYNLIETIRNDIETTTQTVEKSKEDTITRAQMLLGKLKETKLKDIEIYYKIQETELRADYEEQKNILEQQSELDLGSLGIELNLDEISDASSQVKLPIMATTQVNGKEVELYYASNHVLIESKDDYQIQQFMQNLITELIESEEFGIVNIKLVDSEGLGTKFSDILKFKDTDTRITDNVIYTTEDQINEMLDQCIRKISSRVLNLLSQEYSNIYEYNKLSQEKINYEFIFIQDVDKIQDSKIIKKLENIVRQGREWGIFIIASGESLPDKLRYKHTDTIIIDNQPILNIYNDNTLDIEIEIPDYTDKLEKLYEEASEGKADKPFIEMLPKKIWQGDPSEQLEVLIGNKDSGGQQTVKLGGSGINHHILLGGNTGSGKTSFIHTFILSSCLKYSPELLELILIDFKQGVEFQVYEDYKLPHAKFLGLESDREYALNILKYIDADINRRAQLCKSVGASDITSYNEKVEKKMKRTIIIIDEFQELLRGQDNIEQTTRALLDVITRIGRSFGIHLILSSQSISGIPGGLSGVENRLGTRIALRCNEDDSRAILSSNNTAAADLTQIGQGIFNDNQGRVNGNSKFKFGYINNQEAIELLTKIQKKSKETGYVVTTQTFYKSKLRHIDDVEWFNKDIEESDTNLLLGDSSSLTKSYVDISLTRQSGENLLVITKDKRTSQGIRDTIIKSIYHSKQSDGPQEDPNAKIIEIDTNIMNDFTGYIPDIDGIEHRIFGLRDATILISNIHEIIEERRQELEPELLYPIYFIINNCQKIRDLQEDDYTSEITRNFTEVLREGPYYGIHVINLVDTYRSIERVRSKILNESCHRLVGRMNDMDSSYVINDKQASLLDTDIELIYYNDINNEYEKVRLLRTEETE